MFRAILLVSLLAAPVSVAQSQKVTYSYNDAGRLSKVDYGNGQTISYNYDKAGNLIGTTSTPLSADAKKEKPAKEKPAKVSKDSKVKEK